MKQSIKLMLVPVAHAFILLPVAAIFTGSPGVVQLLALLAIALAAGLAGWFVQTQLPFRRTLWITMLLALVLGGLLGYFPLALLYQTAFQRGAYDAPQSWIPALLGLISAGIALWSQLEIRRGLQKALNPTKIGISLALYTMTYFSYRSSGNYMTANNKDMLQPILLPGMLWLMLALIIVNSQYVSRMAYTKGKERVGASILVPNIAMTLIMAGLFIFIASFGFLQEKFGVLLRRLMTMLSSLFFREDGQISEPGEIEKPPEIEPPEDGGASAPEWLTVITNILVTVALIVSAVLLLIFLTKKVIQFSEALKKWLREKRQATVSDEPEYVDEHEDLWRWDQFKKDMGQRIRRPFKRRSRFEDQPDARGKIRWLYRQIVLYLSKLRLFNPTLTPNEVAESCFDRHPSMIQLSHLYNEARFSTHTITDEQVRQAQQALKKLKEKGARVNNTGESNRES